MYACGKCGRKDGLDTSLVDEDWQKIEAHTGCQILCLWCINAACEELGIRVVAQGMYFSGSQVKPPAEGGGVGLLVCLETLRDPLSTLVNTYKNMLEEE